MKWPLQRFLQGQTRIRLQGTGAVRCMNLLLGQDLELRNAWRKDSAVELWVSTKDLKQVQRCAQKCGCEVEALRDKGLPAWRRRYGNRYGFMLGLILAVAAMFFLNCYIWRIDIQGNVQASDTEVLQRLADYGLTEGKWKSGTDLESARNALLLKYPEWSWLSLSIEGSTLEVRLQEATQTPEIYQMGEPRDIVADRDGIIYSIVARRGTPKVRSGDVVRKGDVLISGTITIEMEDGSQKYEYTEAAGEIYALCTYELTDTQEKTYIEKNYTQDTAHELLLQWNDSKISLYKPFRIYENYDIIEETLLEDFASFIAELPGMPHAALVRRSYVFYEPVPKTYREDQLQVLLAAKLQRARQMLVEEHHGVLLEEKITYSDAAESMEGTLFARVMEEMGTPAELTPQVTEPEPEP